MEHTEQDSIKRRLGGDGGKPRPRPALKPWDGGEPRPWHKELCFAFSDVTGSRVASFEKRTELCAALCFAHAPAIG